MSEKKMRTEQEIREQLAKANNIGHQTEVDYADGVQCALAWVLGDIESGPADPDPEEEEGGEAG